MATISTNVPSFSSELIASCLAALGALVALAILVARRRSIGQTTLTSAWWWTVAAFVAWGGAELVVSGDRAWSRLEPLRLAAIAISLCPVVSLIGAKRPQHAAWNFVVLSLWAIVALPAAEAHFLRPGQPLEFGAARGWFLWILIALGPINFVPTRFWHASLLLAAGQVVALSEYLPLLGQDLVAEPGTIGLAIAASAVVAAGLASRHERDTANPYDRLWLDFRDSFGLFWSLRVQERINAVARQQNWDFDLSWSGFRRRADGTLLDAIDPAVEPTLRTSFKGLLRRFISHQWIADRLPQALD